MLWRGVVNRTVSRFPSPVAGLLNFMGLPHAGWHDARRHGSLVGSRCVRSGSAEDWDDSMRSPVEEILSTGRECMGRFPALVDFFRRPTVATQSSACVGVYIM